jgi:hypothetical protein
MMLVFAGITPFPQAVVVVLSRNRREAWSATAEGIPGQRRADKACLVSRLPDGSVSPRVPGQHIVNAKPAEQGSGT